LLLGKLLLEARHADLFPERHSVLPRSRVTLQGHTYEDQRDQNVVYEPLRRTSTTTICYAGLLYSLAAHILGCMGPIASSFTAEASSPGHERPQEHLFDDSRSGSLGSALPVAREARAP